ncbi:hypothetical protein PCIT_a3485 [Pseudoalteromonas citrea]|uniref:Carboxypeptidase regulatory-like domain-containing protein n=2 Tax=Pseudoalteromonas citrea TaxID=43655 RepID=A0AAD4AH64_9GAMM|nr:PKD domain-containing protein [Pseudoalteromonas citrea]KAF7768951.1 hypothetical protein PCIT_a3485 [Pseudoalteromonas citrea]
MRISYLNQVLTAALIGLITGCGGSANANIKPTINQTATEQNKVSIEDNKRTRRGRVIDGYISGATVWLDLNNNHIHDEHEPSTLSTTKGNYLLELSEEDYECSAYVPTYVDVPVGAIDEDLGVVTQAYQMAIPPSLQALTDDQMLHITPLTTVLWQSLNDAPEFKNKTCAQLQQSHASREVLLNKLHNVIQSTTARFNISQSQLFSDYISTGDKETQALAESIVLGLQASLKKQIELEAQYPNASEVRVIHYLAPAKEYEGINELVWHREIAIFTSDDSFFISEDARMADDLSEVLFVYYQRSTESKPWGENGSYTEQTDFAANNSNRFDTCYHDEQVTITQGVTKFTLSNWYSGSPRVNQSCDTTTDFKETEQRVFSISHNENLVNHHTEIHQRLSNSSKVYLNDWYNLSNKSTSLDSQKLIDHLGNSGYFFNEEPSIAFSSWFKRLTDDSLANRIITERNHLNEWVKYTYASDGTHVTQCSTDGEKWLRCN